MARRSGRRPGESGTREAILAAAGRQFAERGYDRTSLRSIAAEAGVDPALVAYFFDSKQQLFVDVTELPFAPEEVVPTVFAGDRARLGQRLATFLLTALAQPEVQRRMTGLVRAAASEPAAAEMVRELISTRVVTPIIEALDVPDAPLRANLLGSQVDRPGDGPARHRPRADSRQLPADAARGGDRPQPAALPDRAAGRRTACERWSELRIRLSVALDLAVVVGVGQRMPRDRLRRSRRWRGAPRHGSGLHASDSATVVPNGRSTGCS